MMTNPAHWPKQTEEKKTLGQVMYDTETDEFQIGDRPPYENIPQKCRKWHERAARNVIEADGSAQKHFTSGLAVGLSLLYPTSSKLVACDNKQLRRLIYSEALSEAVKLIEAAKGYPLTWQPPKEGESIL